MLKPDFGNVDRRIDWNADRIAYVRHLAEARRMSAREIALDIGLAANQAPRIFELAKRCNIELRGQGRRPNAIPAEGGRVYSVSIGGQYTGALTALSERLSLPAGRVVELLANAAIDTGEAFCINLLDMGADDQ